ncbi:MAG: SMP-30/gluconolactonase/LRE family protein [Alphaproteobacteria bacterium]|nr:SMP-30/gluconolactonase/LRE family protein [Alphaproteobacteria bacterium]MCZ6510767.1 SMP-30/gluconolactonase/LRE family protein [Alphaproteobacteria bacterium]MCZ6589046.1 SMP-30/gluconolactonase/LRE family protein [Alphaproteobacteria bacterium]
MATFEVIATGLQFPEGPIAMPDGSVVLVEIARGTLSRVLPGGEVQVIAELGGGPNGAAIGPDGLCYVCNNGGVEWHDFNGMLLPGDAAADYAGGRIERVDLESGASEVLYSECAGQGLRGPNDIVFDAHGGFWFTDTGKSYGRTMDRSGVLYAAADGSSIEEVLFPFQMTNGVALSPDEDMVYFAETLAGRIWQFELSAPGQLASIPQPFDPGNLLYGAPGLTGFDSMAVDNAGNVCQATLIKGGVTVISPDGERTDFIPLPDPFVTNICFGGEDLRIAYITLAGTGRLIKMEWPRPGLALNHLNK